MNARRNWLRAALGAFLPVFAPAQNKRTVKTLFERAIDTPFPNRTIYVVRVDMPPGDPLAAAHKHSGLTIGYVLSGTYRFQVSGEPERLLKAGEVFFEPEGHTHLISGNGSGDQPAAILAVIIGVTGKPVTVPA
ncbi:MAG: cupin domain-containing protein [Acidobacteriota bacterium]